MSTIFMDIDTQYDFVMPNGNLYVPGAEKLIPNFKTLMNLARDKGIKVLSTSDAHALNDPEFEVFPPHCIKGEKGYEKIPETMMEDYLRIGEGGNGLDGPIFVSQIILEKSKFSMFENPKAEKVLKKLNAKRVIIYGVAIDYCVKAAALGLRKRGYETYIVEDAVAAVSPETCLGSMEELKAAGVKFIKTKDVEALLK